MSDTYSVTIPQPHAPWGLPTKTQLQYLSEYIASQGPMSIYGDDGIFAKLEQSLTKLYGADFCILTNTGTSALNSAYFGLGIEQGDEVLVPTYTFLATVTPLLRLGAKIVFCDADPSTGNISPSDLARKLSSRTKVVAITHMWGVPCDMDNITPLLRQAGVKLLEDCSHAHFTRYRGRLLGTFGDVACFSIGAKKTMTSGEGGFLLTSDPEIFVRATFLGHFAVRADQAVDKLRTLGHSGLARKYEALTIGFGENYRMHPYSAVMAHALLDSEEIFKIIENRGTSLRYFAALLREIPGIAPPVVNDDYYSGAMYGFKGHLSVRSISELHEIISTLRERNVSIKLPDTGPLHREAIFGHTDELFPGSAAYLAGCVSLPTFSRGLQKDRTLIEQYGDVIGSVLREKGMR